MDFEKLKKIRNKGFIKDVGLNLTEISDGYAKGELVIEPRHMNPIGSVHGGLIYTIADTVGGSAATSRGRWVTTVSGEMHYLRPAMNCKKLIGESIEVKLGKQLSVYDVMIRDENDVEIAKATLTYYKLRDITEL